jgi:hypothetical protein
MDQNLFYGWGFSPVADTASDNLCPHAADTVLLIFYPYQLTSDHGCSSGEERPDSSNEPSTRPEKARIMWIIWAGAFRGALHLALSSELHLEFLLVVKEDPIHHLDCGL